MTCNPMKSQLTSRAETVGRVPSSLLGTAPVGASDRNPWPQGSVGSRGCELPDQCWHLQASGECSGGDQIPLVLRSRGA
jgi:hypothetical protein